MIQASTLTYSYPTGGFSLRVPDLSVGRGEAVAIIGPSGSGKTTLLNIIAGILRPDGGSMIVADTDLATADDSTARNFRAEQIGLIFQEFELLEYLTVLDNILLPYRISPQLQLSVAIRSRAAMLAAQTGIDDKLDRFPAQLSQGERQRAAVCRALISKPKLLLADEPTGNLDPENKITVLDLLLEMAREHNATLVTVTHDHELVARFDRVINFAELTHTAGRKTE